MFEWLLFNVETYLAATVVVQKSMECFKKLIMQPGPITYRTQKNQ